MTRADQAKNNFNNGYACSQAVAVAFYDLTTLTLEQIEKASLPFGGGMARMRETCGAISGIALIIGLIFSDKASPDNKNTIYARVREVIARYLKVENSTNCKKLLEEAQVEVVIGGEPDKRNTEYYAKRPCARVVYNAAKVLEEYLQEEGIL